MSLRECLTSPEWGVECEPRTCGWRKYADTYIGDHREKTWALAIAYACEKLDSEQERLTARRLANGWHGTGQQLVDVVRQLVAAEQAVAGS